MKPAVSLVPGRPDVALEKRRPLARAEFGQLMVDQAGKCGCGCGEKLQPMGEGVVDEHWIQLAVGGTNDLTNRYLLRKPCAKAKTDKVDTPARAEVKRLRGETKAGPKKAIPGRGFGPRSRKMNGDVGLTKKAQRERGQGE